MKIFMFLIMTLVFFSVNFSTASEDEKFIIGRATIVIGSAYIEKNGKQEKISRGTTFTAEDEIVTRSNGHVHIRFNDNGILSVRPNSKLVIEQYNYNAEIPELSTVKFNLVKGVARSVSGKAAKAARARFRMNTPIAAIGVRGTDFVVSANSDKIKAFVNEGIIVVSPFSSSCMASSLGPCQNDAVELHGNTNKLLELRNQQSSPIVRSIENEALPAFLYSNTQSSDVSEDKEVEDVDASGKESGSKNNDLELDSSEAELIDTIESDSSVSNTKSVVSADTIDGEATAVLIEPVIETQVTTLSVSLEDEIPNTSELSQSPELSYITPSLSADNSVLINRQLVWGRWSANNSTNVNDRISTSFEEASDGRRISVGDSAKGLFREGDISSVLASDLGSVSFDLHFADVDYFSSGTYSQMVVDGGFLDINFEDKSFSTELNLYHDRTGEIDFNSSGSILDSGIFIQNNDTSSINGATSFDGREAGYLFTEELENGTISGSTLWGAP